jgi:lipopolysaccharide export system protein LptA
MKASSRRWGQCIAATLVPAAFAGCAWFREPPEAVPTTAATVYRPTAVMKTIPDTAAAHPVVSVPMDTSKAAGPPPPPPAPGPAATPSAPPPPPTEPLFVSPEGEWAVNGRTLSAVTGPEGQVLHIDAPMITHGTAVLTATQGSYLVDKEAADLQGNVRLRDRGLFARGPHAIYYRNQELLVADQGLVVESDTLHLEGDEGTYDRGQEVVFVRGHVHGIRGTRTITSDEAEWFRERREVFFRGHAVVVDTLEKSRLSGERIRYDLDRDRAEVLESPQLLVSTQKENPILVTGDRLRVNPSGDVEAAGAVGITRGGVLANADSAFFARDRHIAFLFGNPSVTQRDGSLTGDTLQLHFDDKDALQRLEMRGNSSLRFAPVDSTRRGEVSTVRGDSLTMFFKGDSTDHVVVIGKAHSTYRPSPEDRSEGVGTNVVDGDTITIMLTANKIERVRVSGNARGTFIFGATDTAHGQGTREDRGQSPDTLRAPPDTTRLTGAEPPPAEPGQEKVVYAAQEVDFWLETKVVDLHRDITVDYGTLTLTAGKVRFYSPRRYMEAEENPILVDHGSEGKKVVGEHMDYNLHTHEGSIAGGRTQNEAGFIYSEQLRQIGERQFLAKSGNFTTCELAEAGKAPHYHFTSNKMRIYLGDKVIAKPVVMYIRDIPILAVPYYVFSIRKGRHSGFLMADMDLGIGSATGRYFRNLGYYWAASQYWDLMFTTEYTEIPSRFVGRGFVQYAKRYLMSGSLNAAKTLNGNLSQYDVTGAHKMTLGAWNMTARAEFRTSDFRTNEPLGPDLGARADRKLLSDASLTRSFPWNGSFLLSFRQEKDLNPDAQIGDVATILNETLPQYSFQVSPHNLGHKADERQAGHWPFLSTVRVSLSSTGATTHTVNQTRTIVTDSVSTDTTFTQESDRSTQAHHVFNLSDTRRLGNMLNVSPQFILNENWVDREFSPTDTVKGFHRAATWSVSATANTALYGTLPGIGPIRALRHTFRPSASFSYQPEFQSLTYAVTDSSGNTIRRASRFPGVSAQELRFLSLGLEQSLQAKIGSGENPKKISLFRWNLGSAYDFLAKDAGGKPWHQVSSNFTELFGSSLSFTSVHDPYHQFRFQNFQVTGVGYHLKGKFPGGGDELTAGEKEAKPTGDETAWTSLGGDQALGQRPGQRQGESDALTWSADFTISYGGFRNGDAFTTAATVNASFVARLTRNWNLSYRPITWDVSNGRIDGDSFQLTRYLHCWEADFGRTRSGDETSFFFKISIRDLPSIQYQQGKQGATGMQTLTQFLP